MRPPVNAAAEAVAAGAGVTTWLPVAGEAWACVGAGVSTTGACVAPAADAGWVAATAGWVAATAGWVAATGAVAAGVDTMGADGRAGEPVAGDGVADPLPVQAASRSIRPAAVASAVGTRVRPVRSAEAGCPGRG
jgi:hypothetical protein